MAKVPRWDDSYGRMSRDYGEAWAAANRSVILLVRSVVVRMERNLLINPAHPEFPRITAGLHQPAWWDTRLFGSGT